MPEEATATATTTATTDEQDLVRALDNVSQATASLGGDQGQPADVSTDTAPSVDTTPSDAPSPAIPPIPLPDLSPSVPPVSSSDPQTTTLPSPTLPPVPPTLHVPNDAVSSTVANSGPLDSIKKDALDELRPLVDKLNVSPEEKFDTYLLLIRSTDDTNLIAPAHEAAKAISDEARRAEALLDIIKEIDFLSQQQKKS